MDVVTDSKLLQTLINGIIFLLGHKINSVQGPRFFSGQQAMAPSKEILQNILNDREDEHSSYFNNICGSVCEYAFGSQTQQTATTKGTPFRVYNTIAGYFQNVKDYKNEEAKAKSIFFGTGFNKSQNAFRLCTEFEKIKN